MNAFEDFWLAIGDRVKVVAPPPAERSIEMRRVLAARAFEHWREGRLKITLPCDVSPQPRERPEDEGERCPACGVGKDWRFDLVGPGRGEWPGAKWGFSCERCGDWSSTIRDDAWIEAMARRAGTLL